MKPFFSIIIPTYNRAQLITKAIESVLLQTFSDWELIIVDDGSTDNTKDIIEKYFQQEKRIKYLYQQNSERSAARNNGIKNSFGTYICFLDSDDYYLPDRLEKLHSEIVRNNDSAAFYYTGIVFNVADKFFEKPELKNEFSEICDFIALAFIGTPQVCIHRSILTQNIFDPEFRIGEDMELWLRISKTAIPKYLENQFTVVALDHDNRSVNVKQYNSYTDQLRMLKKIFVKDHSGNKISGNVKRTLISNAYFGIAKYHLHKNSFLKADYNLLRAIVTDISSNQTKYRINIFLQTIPIIGNKNKLMRLIENKA